MDVPLHYYIKLRNSLFLINGIRFYVLIIDLEKIKNRLIKGDSYFIHFVFF